MALSLPLDYLTWNLDFGQIDAKRVLREIIIMKNLLHENILGLLDVVYIPKDG